MEHILVTGTNGMVGSYTVKGLLNSGYKVLGLDFTDKKVDEPNYIHLKIDLRCCTDVEAVFERYDVSHIIHLAAIAHKNSNYDTSWSTYYRINTLCAVTLFECAAARKIPVLFASTADVYGITKKTVSAQTECHPVSYYAKSKHMAEVILSRLCDASNTPFAIFRFAPIYTETIKRDIQKRYYLKYPYLAYRIGKGIEYEVLSIGNAVHEITSWIKNCQTTKIVNIKDPQRLRTEKAIVEEKLAGRARHVITFPFWMIAVGYIVLNAIFGEKDIVFLLGKVVYPLRTE